MPSNISSRKTLRENSKVIKLIDFDIKWWNGPLIQAIFCKEEAEIIISHVPLISKYGQKDKSIWRGSTIGEFTIRSAYHMEKDRQKVQCREGSQKSYMNNNIREDNLGK
jgi:hypothetical protein